MFGKKNSRIKLTVLSMLCLSSPIVTSSCCLHCRHSHDHLSAKHTLVGAPSNADAHCCHLPLPPPLSNASLLPSPHHRLAVIHCCPHLLPPLLNTIFVTAASPSPCRWPLPPILDAIIILLCHCCCCRPSPPSNADTRLRQPPPLASNTIFASPLPHLSLSPLPSNTVECCCRHRTPPPPPPLNAVFIVQRCHRSHRCRHHWRCLPPHHRPLTNKEAAAPPPPVYQWQHQGENVYKSRGLGLIQLIY